MYNRRECIAVVSRGKRAKSTSAADAGADRPQSIDGERDKNEEGRRKRQGGTERGRPNASSPRRGLLLFFLASRREREGKGERREFLLVGLGGFGARRLGDGGDPSGLGPPAALRGPGRLGLCRLTLRVHKLTCVALVVLNPAIRPLVGGGASEEKQGSNDRRDPSQKRKNDENPLHRPSNAKCLALPLRLFAIFHYFHYVSGGLPCNPYNTNKSQTRVALPNPFHPPAARPSRYMCKKEVFLVGWRLSFLPPPRFTLTHNQAVHNNTRLPPTNVTKEGGVQSSSLLLPSSSSSLSSCV